MKRKEAPSSERSPAKKPRPQVPEYHETPSIKEEDGSIQWPAPKDQMENAREIILTWCVRFLVVVSLDIELTRKQRKSEQEDLNCAR